MATLIRLAAVVLAAAVLAPTAAAADRSAGDYLKAVFVQELNGQYGRAWDSLYPAQQRIVKRDRFIDCMERTAVDATLQGFKVIDSYREKVSVPGTDLRVPSTAVTYRMTVTDSAGKTSAFNSTSHAFLVDGRWRWTLEAQVMAGYKAGRCV